MTASAARRLVRVNDLGEAIEVNVRFELRGIEKRGSVIAGNGREQHCGEDVLRSGQGGQARGVGADCTCALGHAALAYQFAGSEKSISTQIHPPFVRLVQASRERGH